MAKRKWTPEERERYRAVITAGEEARVRLVAWMERTEARLSEERERRERRRRLLRRLMPFRRAA